MGGYFVLVQCPLRVLLLLRSLSEESGLQPGQPASRRLAVVCQSSTELPLGKE